MSVQPRLVPENLRRGIMKLAASSSVASALVNPMAQASDYGRDWDGEGTSETRQQHASSCYRNKVN
jgi:hypothetical protein